MLSVDDFLYYQSILAAHNPLEYLPKKPKSVGLAFSEGLRWLMQWVVNRADIEGLPKS